MATSVTLKPNAIDISGSTSGTTTLQASAVAGTTTLTLPAATDTLVGKATTDTLTNKTLTGAAMNGTLGATTPSTASVTTLTTSSTVTHSGGTANGVAYLDGSKVLTTGSALVFDGSNLGVGVTPSAWATANNVKALQVGPSGVASFWNYSNNAAFVGCGYYWNGTNRIYLTTGNPISEYSQNSGVHSWNIAASGTAGNAITFTQAMTLTADGNLGVGTTSPAGLLEVRKDQNSATYTYITNQSTGASGQAILRMANSATGMNLAYTSSGYSTVVNYDVASGGYLASAGSGGLSLAATDSTAVIRFYSGGTTERARITSGGFSKFSNTGTYVTAASYHEFVTDGATNILYLRNTNANPYGFEVNFNNATPNNTTQYFFSCSDSTNQKAVIYSSGTFGSRTSTYGGISDIKVKQDIVDASSQWGDIKALRFRKYRFKDDPTGPLQLGLISQEAELVSPGLVFETPDTTTDEEGNKVETSEVTKSVKYSILYMKAVVALQEAMNRIEQLEADVAALKGASA